MEKYFEPTHEKPWIFDNIKIYPDHMILNETRIDLDEIWCIYFDSNEDSTNGITTSRTAHCKIFYHNEDKMSLIPKLTYNAEIGNVRSSLFLYKEKLNNTLYMYQLLAKLTFNSRLNRYLNEVKTNGFFTTFGENIKIYNNGDIITPKGTKVNIPIAIKEGLFGFGETAKGIKSTITKANSIVIYPNKGLKISLFGAIDLYSKIEISTSANGDILIEIMKRIGLNGSIL